MKTDLNKEIKEEDERRALLNQPVKEVRAMTKNRFPAAIWPTPGDLYIQDRNWLKKANPEAHLAEKEYLERDYQVLEKRRNQKKLQAIDMENQMKKT